MQHAHVSVARRKLLVAAEITTEAVSIDARLDISAAKDIAWA